MTIPLYLEALWDRQRSIMFGSARKHFGELKPFFISPMLRRNSHFVNELPPIFYLEKGDRIRVLGKLIVDINNHTDIIQLSYSSTLPRAKMKHKSFISPCAMLVNDGTLTSFYFWNIKQNILSWLNGESMGRFCSCFQIKVYLDCLH